MWTLLASLLILRRGRGERSITYAALTIAIAMTLNIDSVYETLDGLAGGTNFVTLVADLALMVGIFFLGRGVNRASDHQSRAVQLALGRAVLAIAFVCAVVTFFLIDRGATTTNFMLDLGNQPAAAAYSTIHFLYYGIVVAAMAVLSARQIRVNEGALRLPSVSLLLGSVLGVMLAVIVIVMNLAHVAGNLGLMSAVSEAYGPLNLLTFLFLCLGFAGQPAARAMQTRSREQRARMLVRELDPLWAAATALRPGISQNETAAFNADEPETLLHRHVVEIRDAMIDTRVSFELSEGERQLLERAELHLLGASSTGIPSSSMSRIEIVDGQQRA
ncbi:hypothetical protein SAMN04489834_2249 [Microterricola viridarii]|uniref:DUF6545 domain-containing protein n=2 Tax=Microterricola viridarii TaxID=412690 RepID=A0A1H1VG34_9MICO|nr:MAB_1171c family putative transporter [Microterricola viridarii]SDS83376.1 hypothetical protein SAMN04489834_2249 [Microterricola viridarii]